jgi:hypothetical protein
MYLVTENQQGMKFKQVKLSDSLKEAVSEILGSCPDEVAVVDSNDPVYRILKRNCTQKEYELFKPALEVFMSNQYQIDQSNYIYEDIEYEVGLYFVSKNREENTFSVKVTNKKLDELRRYVGKTAELLEDTLNSPTGFLVKQALSKGAVPARPFIGNLIHSLNYLDKEVKNAISRPKQDKHICRPAEVAKSKFIRNMEEIYNDFTFTTGLSLNKKQLKCDFIRVVAKEFNIKIPGTDSALRKYLKPTL